MGNDNFSRVHWLAYPTPHTPFLFNVLLLFFQTIAGKIGRTGETVLLGQARTQKDLICQDRVEFIARTDFRQGCEGKGF